MRELSDANAFDDFAGQEVELDGFVASVAQHYGGSLTLNRDTGGQLATAKGNLPRRAELALAKRDHQNRLGSCGSQQRLLAGHVGETVPQAGKFESAGDFVPPFVIGLQVLRALTRIGADNEPVRRFDEVQRRVRRRHAVGRGTIGVT